MILETGSKILVAHRRLFAGDHARFFAGVVEGYEAGIVRVCGHTWQMDAYQGTFQRKEDERTKLLSLSSGTLIVYVLPSTADMASLHLASTCGEITLCDANGPVMDLTEGVLHGAPLSPVR